MVYRILGVGEHLWSLISPMVDFGIRGDVSRLGLIFGVIVFFYRCFYESTERVGAGLLAEQIGCVRGR